MSGNWEQQEERSNPLMLRLLLWIAHALGRRTARLLLYPIVGYFLVTGGAALATIVDSGAGSAGRAGSGATFAAVFARSNARLLAASSAIASRTSASSKPRWRKRRK